MNGKVATPVVQPRAPGKQMDILAAYWSKAGLIANGILLLHLVGATAVGLLLGKPAQLLSSRGFHPIASIDRNEAPSMLSKSPGLGRDCDVAAGATGTLTMLSLENMRAFLEEAARRRRVVTYRDIASVFEVWPPNTIHQATDILERLMEEDAAEHRPFIAALAVSGTLGDAPRRGFFDCAGRLGRFDGDPEGQDARIYHTNELNAAFAYWGGADDR